MAMAKFLPACRVADIPPGHVGYAEVDGVRLAICNADGAFYAVDDVCTHDGGSLDQGELDGFNIECPRHGARFDIRTGRVTALPAIRPIGTYHVQVDEDAVMVDVDA
jgi:3-phenylpropionate/trans-cinnamate dioxygenase ferredoxin component